VVVPFNQPSRIETHLEADDVHVPRFLPPRNILFCQVTAAAIIPYTLAALEKIVTNVGKLSRRTEACVGVVILPSADYRAKTYVLQLARCFLVELEAFRLLSAGSDTSPTCT
jgi:hypothetical protein